MESSDELLVQMNKFEDTFGNDSQVILVNHVVCNLLDQFFNWPPTQTHQTPILQNIILMILIISLNQFFLISFEQNLFGFT